ncbi:hypothetical protein Dda_7336 [Drechslerella dactyloides]|uniref:Uncharacterized protein n=1 Tax=Drechslerella dactyloides TaxID=74499 RepID=A0AAD6IVH3_DREDA|nr:hypothetical protein Dda_7336 [Drechslerella dactyloides]
MVAKLAVFLASLVGGVFGAALPAASDKVSIEKRDHLKVSYLWAVGSDYNLPDDYSQKTDDAWRKVELEFEMKIFEKSSTTAWISMNGAFCLDDPTGLGPSAPATSLPVDPSQCNGKGCLPSNCVLPLWGDYYLPKNAESQRIVRLTYHYPSGAPQIGHHYHISWVVCRKGSKAGSAVQYEDCGSDRIGFVMNVFKSHPGQFYVYYGEMPANTPGIIGAQSFPKFIQTSGTPKPYQGSLSCAVIDTITGNVTAGKSREDCSPAGA